MSTDKLTPEYREKISRCRDLMDQIANEAACQSYVNVKNTRDEALGIIEALALEAQEKSQHIEVLAGALVRRDTRRIDIAARAQLIEHGAKIDLLGARVEALEQDQKRLER
jgi:hypothetical protein